MEVLIKRGEVLLVSVEGLESFPQTISYDEAFGFTVEKLAAQARQAAQQREADRVAALNNAIAVTNTNTLGVAGQAAVEEPQTEGETNA
jgi:hypothetical protein